MGMDVYANNMAIACKAADGKTIAAFPDVCFTPPLTPATPPGVPIPYPNTAMASDTTNGTKTVMIAGQEVMLKNISVFKTSTGDEAGSAPKKGVVTSTIKGEANFICWSMDVKFEGENVPRHLDMMGHNEQCDPTNTPPWPYLDKLSISLDHPCVGDMKNEYKDCQGYKPYGDKDVCLDAGLGGGVVQGNKAAKKLGFKTSKAWAADMSQKAAANKCVSARRCRLSPYDAEKDGVKGCCPSQTADHLIPKSSFFKVSFDHGAKLGDWKNYDYSKAPCLCAEGGSNTAGSHGLRHAHHKANGPGKGAMQPFKKEAALASKGATTVLKSSGCSESCIQNQLEEGHKAMGNVDGNVKHSPSGSTMTNQEITAQAGAYSPETVAP